MKRHTNFNLSIGDLREKKKDILGIFEDIYWTENQRGKSDLKWINR